MPFAFIHFRRALLMHGMSLSNKKSVCIISGISGSGKSSSTALLAKNYEIRSEDIMKI